MAEGRKRGQFATDFADDKGIYIADVIWEVTTPRPDARKRVQHQDRRPGGDRGRRHQPGGSGAAAIRHLPGADFRPTASCRGPASEPLRAPARPGPERSAGHAAALLADLRRLRHGRDYPRKHARTMRDVAIAVGTTDAPHGPGVRRCGCVATWFDRQRIELHEVLLRFGGVRIGQLGDVAMQQRSLVLEYRDLIYEMPFQFPTDVLFAMRAVAILSGMATTLGPHFDPGPPRFPLPSGLASEQITRDGAASSMRSTPRSARCGCRPAGQALSAAGAATLCSRPPWRPDTAQAIRRLERSMERLTWSMIAGGLLMAGLLLQTRRRLRRQQARSWSARQGRLPLGLTAAESPAR